MKTLITVSLTVGLLLAAIRWSGQSIDAGSFFAVLVASSLAALFVRDYRTPSRPARRVKATLVARPAAPSVVPQVLPVRGVIVTARFARSAGARAGAISVGS